MIAFRTDARLEEKLQRRAVATKKTKTDVIREALEAYLDDGARPISPIKGRSAADVLKADIGVWNGPADTSVSTGKQLGSILVEKHRARRM